MSSALIGHTGFVGGNLARQMNFSEFYNSKNIDDVRGRTFDLVVCAGAPGRKWYANENPVEDLASIRKLMRAVREVDAARFVLVSTVDVYAVPRGVDEDIRPVGTELHSYGRHRLVLESCVRRVFGDRATILRLPALFAPGLKKNALYDLMNDNDVGRVPANAAYQWYPLAELRRSIGWALGGGHSIVNLVSDPIEMGVVQRRFFPAARLGPARDDAPSYAVESRYGRIPESFILGRMAEFLQETAR